MFSRRITLSNEGFLEPLPYEPAYKEARKIKIAFKGDSQIRALSSKDFERLTAVRYLDHLLFPNRSFFENLRGKVKKAFDLGQIDKQTEWFGFQYRNELLQGKVADVSIRWIDNALGFGLFADSKLKPGEFIGEYTGFVKCVSRFFSSQINPYCFRYPLHNKKLFIYAIDAENAGNEISFVNHSKTPNAEAIVTINHHLLHVILRALTPIEKGEEILFDYGQDLFD